MRPRRLGIILIAAAVVGVAAVIAVILTAHSSGVERSALATAGSQAEQEQAAALNPSDLFPLDSLPSTANGAAIQLRGTQTCCIIAAPGCASCSEYAGVAEGLGAAYPGIQFVLLMVGTDGSGVVAGPHMRLAVDQERKAASKLSDHDAVAPAVFLIRTDGTIAWKVIGVKLQLVWNELNEALGGFSRSRSGVLPGSEVTPKVGEKLASALCAGTPVDPVSTDRDTVFLLSHSTYLSTDSMKLQADLLAQLRDVANPVLVVSIYDEARWRAALDYHALYSSTSTQTSTQNMRLVPSINRGEVAKVEEYVDQHHLGVTVIPDTCWSYVLTYGQSSSTSLIVVASDRTVKAVIPYSLTGSSADRTLARYVRSIIENR
ncbi:MAG: hypothetical protein ACYDH4_09835 [Candidatus Cryosericum sp.]